MQAVIKTGGKQYIVTEGQRLSVERLPSEEGDKLEFEEVLLVDDGKKVSVGMPTVPNAKVSATVEKQGRSRTIDVIKYKAKVRYRRKIGHRQHFTKVLIDKIMTS
ncbi:50S ribosomal protein L21 [Candidatus Uhrbacteria bacterium CG10_big_fil_rev_8_21_14_0_10_48_11]|uniref:Large ribosomal subunit protein bL21 n=1 Tax=Candidatus Uhrbacteria bacterium CG10_big_fil_rev_8_21_14_0_10_48_11 TaxID=1975037 RepID=A0A2M8LFL3_9BACT|nr:MAG: 50S ribosomal protein L21 [Candidatus Uhrbacteria bacterium CG10_big_fil_rev_8_21_14_0_10_48_11]